MCEKAVELAPENKLSLFRAYRGVAKAQTGDKDGARKDFQSYIEKTDNEKSKTLVQGWLKTLQQGQNPFTEEVLKKLRGE